MSSITSKIIRFPLPHEDLEISIRVMYCYSRLLWIHLETIGTFSIFIILLHVVRIHNFGLQINIVWRNSIALTIIIIKHNCCAKHSVIVEN